MTERSVRRRVFLSGVGAVVAAAGCISTSPTPPGNGGDGRNSSDTDGGTTVEQLTVGGSSTVYPVTSTAAAFWSLNSATNDEKHWGPSQYGIDTDARLADYWASRYGFEPTGNAGEPPFDVSVNLSHSGTGLKNLRDGRIDVGNASAPVEAEFSDLGDAELDRFADHVVGVDAQPIVVSQAIYDAGVTRMTADTLKAIYRGEIENWREVEGYDGPDEAIQAVGRAVGSGTDTAFRANLLGSPDAEIDPDVRKGENQQVKTTVTNSDNAIAYMALAFVDDSVPAIALEYEGTLYEPGENLADEGYPLSRDLHCYTYDGTSTKEAAYLRMIISDYGQENFVTPEGYSALTDDRQREQLDALPDPQ